MKHVDYLRYQSNHNIHATAIRNYLQNQHIATCSHTKFFSSYLEYVFGYASIHVFLQYFDNFCYHSIHTFHATAKTNHVNNYHFATCAHIKFHQASLYSFLVILGFICFCIISAIFVAIATLIFIGRYKQNNAHNKNIVTLPYTNFHKGSLIIF